MAIRTSEQLLGTFDQTDERTRLGVQGAFRITGTDQVFTAGDKGRLIESGTDLLSQGFRQDEVLEVSFEEAQSIGFTGAAPQQFGDTPTAEPTTADVTKGLTESDIFAQAQDVTTPAPLIREIGTQDVFQISPEGRKRLIENPDVLSKLGRTFSEVLNVIPDVIKQFSEGMPRSQLTASIFNTSQIFTSIERQFGVIKARQETEESRQSILELLKSLPGALLAERDKLRSEFSVAQKEAALSVIDADIAAFVGATNIGIEQLKGQAIPGVFITGQVAQATAIANIRLQSLQGKRAAISGNLDRARLIINQSMSEFFSMQELQLDALGQAADIISAQLGEKEKRASVLFALAIQEQQNELVLRREEGNTVRELMLNYPLANIEVSDTIGEATFKAQQMLKLNTSNFQLFNTSAGVVEVEIDAKTGKVISSRVLGGGGGLTDLSGLLPEFSPDGVKGEITDAINRLNNAVDTNSFNDVLRTIPQDIVSFIKIKRDIASISEFSASVNFTPTKDDLESIIQRRRQVAIFGITASDDTNVNTGTSGDIQNTETLYLSILMGLKNGDSIESIRVDMRNLYPNLNIVSFNKIVAWAETDFNSGFTGIKIEAKTTGLSIEEQASFFQGQLSISDLNK